LIPNVCTVRVRPNGDFVHLEITPGADLQLLSKAIPLAHKEALLLSNIESAKVQKNLVNWLKDILATDNVVPISKNSDFTVVDKENLN
jgi:hypothetical protein